MRGVAVVVSVSVVGFWGGLVVVAVVIVIFDARSKQARTGAAVWKSRASLIVMAPVGKACQLVYRAADPLAGPHPPPPLQAPVACG